MNSRAQRYELKLSLLILDLDYFKQVNDDHGHQIGDMVLATTGSLIASSIRSADIPARYGGEEIAILAPSTDIEGTFNPQHSPPLTRKPSRET